MRWKAFTFASLSLIVGLALGNKFPDIDQDTALLVHRSVFTHGPLLPFLLFLVASGIRFAPLRLFAMGFSLGVAFHLSFDLFPKAWQGFALIHVPVSSCYWLDLPFGFLGLDSAEHHLMSLYGSGTSQKRRPRYGARVRCAGNVRLRCPKRGRGMGSAALVDRGNFDRSSGPSLEAVWKRSGTVQRRMVGKAALSCQGASLGPTP